MKVKLILYSVKKDNFIKKLHKVVKENLQGELCRFYFTDEELMKINDDGQFDINIKFICYENFANKLLEIGQFDQASEFISYIDTMVPFYTNLSARRILNVNSNCLRLSKNGMRDFIKYIYEKLSNLYDAPVSELSLSILQKKNIFNHKDIASELNKKNILLTYTDLESLYYNLIFIYKTFDFTYNELFLYYE